jgi:hypothetical protein
MYEDGMRRKKEMDSQSKEQSKLQRKAVPKISLRCNRMYEEGMRKNRLKIEKSKLPELSVKKALPSRSVRCDRLYELSTKKQHVGKYLREKIRKKATTVKNTDHTLQNAYQRQIHPGVERLYQLSQKQKLLGKQRRENIAKASSLNRPPIRM